MSALEGTYLAWVDFSKLGVPPRELNSLIMKEAKLWLSDGLVFGEAGAGFQRINIATPRKILHQALERLAEFVKLLKG
jgi:cystathionine beta-lyase